MSAKIGRTVISFHVPKCFGTSAGQVLHRWYAPDFEYCYSRPLLWSPLYLAKEYCVHGHLDRRLDQHFLVDCSAITFLRDPFEMVASAYSFGKGRGYHLPASLDDYVDAICMGGGLGEYQFLPIDPNDSGAIRFFTRSFAFVGICEFFDESFSRLASMLEKPPAPLPHSNASDRLDEWTTRSKARFERRFSQEIAFYRHFRDKMAP